MKNRGRQRSRDSSSAQLENLGMFLRDKLKRFMMMPPKSIPRAPAGRFTDPGREKRYWSSSNRKSAPQLIQHQNEANLTMGIEENVHPSPWQVVPCDCEGETRALVFPMLTEAWRIMEPSLLHLKSTLLAYCDANLGCHASEKTTGQLEQNWVQWLYPTMLICLQDDSISVSLKRTSFGRKGETLQTDS